MKIGLDQLNFKKNAKYLGVKVWQTPNFLFLMMGIIIAITLLVVYCVAKNDSDPAILLVAECFIAAVMLLIGSNIIGRVTEIAEINRLKTRFLEMVSSHLKDPLATMRWEMEMLLERTEGELNEKQRERIDSIIETNETMINLVKDLLDVTRIEDQKEIKAEDEIKVQQLMQTIINDQKEYAKARQIRINFNNQAPGVFIQGNKKLLKIAIENLVSNAIRFSPKKKEVFLSVIPKRHRILIKIKDNGYGIPEADQKRIFDKFFRAGNILRHNMEGTGLGLYVSKKIVESSGGKIWFNSQENKGSEFFIQLPLN